MQWLDLMAVCPRCGSQNVVYSCEPTCCFNHVCGDCLANFELSTDDLGGELPAVNIESHHRDSTAPTAACARCGSLDLYAVDTGVSTDQPVVCASCHARLKLMTHAEL